MSWASWWNDKGRYKHHDDEIIYNAYIGELAWWYHKMCNVWDMAGTRRICSSCVGQDSWFNLHHCNTYTAQLLVSSLIFIKAALDLVKLRWLNLSISLVWLIQLSSAILSFIKFTTVFQMSFSLFFLKCWKVLIVWSNTSNSSTRNDVFDFTETGEGM